MDSGENRRTRPGAWLTRPVWVASGFLALGLGALGVVLPLLPTTPLVILAAFCFSRGAPGLGVWLENSRLWGPILADWREHGAIAPRFKAIAVAMMAAVLVASLAADVSGWILGLQALLITLGAGFVLSRPNAG